MPKWEITRNGGASSGCRERKGRMMDKIDFGKALTINVDCNLGRILTLQEKVNELVEEWNSHKEWHRRFFDKYNKAEPD